MTDEELEKELQCLCEKIGNPPEAKESLSKKEKGERRMLTYQKETLEKIKLARQKHDRDAEIRGILIYGMLTTWIGRYPYLMHVLVNSRIGQRFIF